MGRKVGDRVTEISGELHGSITDIHEVPGHPELVEYSIAWDSGEYPDEIWSEQDLLPVE